jgi:phospholipid-binding lipoprotein MlaA
VRDTFGRADDTFSSPRAYIKNNYWKYGTGLVNVVDVRSRYLDADHLIDSAYDPYAFLRNAYLQNRAFKVRGGNSRNEEDEEQKMLEESGIEPTPPQPQPPEEPRQPK